MASKTIDDPKNFEDAAEIAERLASLVEQCCAFSCSLKQALRALPASSCGGVANATIVPKLAEAEVPVGVVKKDAAGGVAIPKPSKAQPTAQSMPGADGKVVVSSWKCKVVWKAARVHGVQSHCNYRILSRVAPSVCPRCEVLAAVNKCSFLDVTPNWRHGSMNIAPCEIKSRTEKWASQELRRLEGLQKLVADAAVVTPKVYQSAPVPSLAADAAAVPPKVPTSAPALSMPPAVRLSPQPPWKKGPRPPSTPPPASVLRPSESGVCVAKSPSGCAVGAGKSSSLPLPRSPSDQNLSLLERGELVLPPIPPVFHPPPPPPPKRWRPSEPATPTAVKASAPVPSLVTTPRFGSTDGAPNPFSEPLQLALKKVADEATLACGTGQEEEVGGPSASSAVGGESLAVAALVIGDLLRDADSQASTVASAGDMDEVAPSPRKRIVPELVTSEEELKAISQRAQECAEEMVGASKRAAQSSLDASRLKLARADELRARAVASIEQQTEFEVPPETGGSKVLPVDLEPSSPTPTVGSDDDEFGG